MNAASTETGQPAAVPAASVSAHIRPFYWSVVRELWEHRSLYFAPLIAAGVMLLAVLFNASHFTEVMQVLENLEPARQRALVFSVSSGIWVLLAITMVIVIAFYSLDALHAERRDRSVLFWKSMPVSDLTTVSAKLFTALVVAPAIIFVITIVTQVLVMLIGSVVVLASGQNAALIWSNLEFIELLIALLYALVAVSLWYAPIYAWLLLISSWAKRSPFLWAALPPVAVALFESVAFDTSYFLDMLGYRLQGGLASAFMGSMMGSGVVIGDRGAELRTGGHFPDHVLDTLSPLEFLANPWLWVGLVAAAAFAAAAVWMRRYREPI